jgi:hypothetical protein
MARRRAALRPGKKVGFPGGRFLCGLCHKVPLVAFLVDGCLDKL